MGLFSKWKKKKEQEQLEATRKSADIDVVKKEKSKKVEKEEAAKKEKAPIKAKETIKKGQAGRAYKILVRPVVSEKAATAETQGKYTFIVGMHASKEQIKEAVAEVYGVRPTQVRTQMYEGKRVRFGYTKGKRKDWKKVLVQLPKGHTISIHEGV